MDDADEKRLAQSQQAPTVAICIPTYKRPIFLRNLLESILQANLDGLKLQLIVADNDPLGSAQEVVTQLALRFPFRVKYVVEPIQGIASGRNCLVREAAAIGATYIAFVDDDTTVDPSWLSSLVEVAQSTGADAVCGVSVVEFEEGCPEWVKNAGLSFQPARRKTGASVRGGSTANALFRTSSLTQLKGPFDERLNLLGGSDLVLFEEFYRRGFISIWCDESIVHELYPTSRATVSWILRRHYRVGVAWARAKKWVEPQMGEMVYWSVRSSGSLAKNGLLLIPATFSGKHTLLLHVARIAHSLGMWAGLLGRGNTYMEYKVVHGR